MIEKASDGPSAGNSYLNINRSFFVSTKITLFFCISDKINKNNLNILSTSEKILFTAKFYNVTVTMQRPNTCKQQVIKMDILGHMPHTVSVSLVFTCL